ncbi:MAG: hypothetical protein WC814_03080 [Candidatus Paceibacterota bacterium]|jgi:hypothetical protein
MTKQSNIERIVMRRVRLIRILGLIISTAVFAVLTFTVALWGIGREVWVARVFQNAPADFAHLPNFFFAAFLHTGFIVQVLTLLTLASFIFLARETLRVLSSIFFPPRD